MRVGKMVVMAVVAVLLVGGCATMMGEKAPAEMREYEYIGEVPGVSKDELFVRVNKWMVSTFVSSEAVIEYQDKEAGEIAGKYVFSYAEGVYTYDVRQQVSISVREGRYRFRVENPMFRATSGLGETYSDTPYRPLETESGLERARQEWKQLKDDLDQAIRQSDDF